MARAGEGLRRIANRQRDKRGDLTAILGRGVPFVDERPTLYQPGTIARPGNKTDLDALISQIQRFTAAQAAGATGNTGDLGVGQGGPLANLFDLLQRQQLSGDTGLTPGGPGDLYLPEGQNWLQSFVDAMTSFQDEQAGLAERNRAELAAMGLAPLRGTDEAEAAQERARMLLSGGVQKPAVGGNTSSSQRGAPTPGAVQQPPQANQAPTATSGAPANPELDAIATALSPAGGMFGPNGSRRFFYGNAAPVGGYRPRFGSRTYL